MAGVTRQKACVRSAYAHAAHTAPARHTHRRIPNSHCSLRPGLTRSLVRIALAVVVCQHTTHTSCLFLATSTTSLSLHGAARQEAPPRPAACPGFLPGPRACPLVAVLIALASLPSAWDRKRRAFQPPFLLPAQSVLRQRLDSTRKEPPTGLWPSPVAAAAARPSSPDCSSCSWFLLPLSKSPTIGAPARCCCCCSVLPPPLPCDIARSQTLPDSKTHTASLADPGVSPSWTSFKR